MENYVLNNGVEIPVMGLGTFPMNKWVLIKAMLTATRAGYNSFDTAQAYNNQKSVGYGLKLCGKKRENIFITTKLSNCEQRNGDVQSALKNSLDLLKIKYIDLYLMHWPNPDTYLDSWKQMEQLHKQGLIRAIGVCNFHQHHLEKLMEIADVLPAVNQIELHPLLSQKKLVEFCEEKTIRVQAYSPLARMNEKLINNEVLISLSKKYNKTVAQIILRWDYQNGIITIAKTQTSQRIKENIEIFHFALTEEDMKAINSINQDFRVRHDPDNCDFLKL